MPWGRKKISGEGEEKGEWRLDGGKKKPGLVGDASASGTETKRRDEVRRGENTRVAVTADWCLDGAVTKIPTKRPLPF